MCQEGSSGMNIVGSDVTIATIVSVIFTVEIAPSSLLSIGSSSSLRSSTFDRAGSENFSVALDVSDKFEIAKTVEIFNSSGN